MDFQNIRFYIQIRTELGIGYKDIFNELKSVRPAQTPSIKTVFNWQSRFKKGHKIIKDQHRSGRPITATKSSNVLTVKSLIDNNPWCNYDEIEAETSLSRGTIFNIIHEKLKLKKLTSRWVPHELTEKNRLERVRCCKENLAKFKENKWRLGDVVTGDECWVYHRKIAKKQLNASWVKEGDKPRTVVRLNRFEQKTMFTIFFKRSGCLHITYMDKGKTINKDSYINDCLVPLVNTLKRQRPSTGAKNIKLHHDNARPHVHKDVKSFIKEEQMVSMEHPPYSPDLAPCDFWLFDYIKQRLVDATGPEDLRKQITKIVDSIDIKEWERTFEKWLERMERCLKHKGHYFEHIYK